MMDIIIRKAQSNDIDELEILYNDLCDFLETKVYNPGWRKGCFPTRKEAFYFWKRDALFLARADNKIVGSVALTHDPNSEADEHLQFGKADHELFYIHILAVHPDYLHKGIGTAILQFAEQLGRQEGIKAIRLYVYENNSVAIKTYEKNGYIYINKEDMGLREFGLEWFYLYEKTL